MTSPASAAPAHMPSLDLFWETAGAYQRSAALKAAVELELFTAIGEGNETAPALAKRCGASPRGVRILCDCLVIWKFLTKDGDRYRLTADSAFFLDRRSPAYMATVALFLNSPMFTPYFASLTDAVRQGGTAASAEGTVGPENPIWVEFARTMTPLMALPAEMMAGILKVSEAGPCKVLDIAAGHGIFGITLAKHNPQAQVYPLDWPSVLELAKENAQKAGLDGRYHPMPGSAFEVEFGTGYDIVLMTNFLHHFDVPTCEALLRRCHAALKPTGCVATIELVPNDDRVSPPQAAAFSLIMLATTRAGDAYTYAEIESMARNAGFARSEIHALPPTPSHLIVSRKN